MPQFYIELKPSIPGVYFESHAFSTASEELGALAKRLGIKNHFELFSFGAQNDMCSPENQEMEVPWFEASVGTEWLDTIMQAIRSEPESVPQSERLLEDFVECSDVLTKAEMEGAKWHFAMDI